MYSFEKDYKIRSSESLMTRGLLWQRVDGCSLVEEWYPRLKV